jgi:hypothetical protein
MTHIQVHLSVQQNLHFIQLWKLTLYAHPFIKAALYLLESLLGLLEVILGID